MEDLINDQILERLYEEAFDEISIAQFAIYLSVSQPNDSKEFTDFVDKFRDGFEESAAKLARKRFEEQAQWATITKFGLSLEVITGWK